MQQVAAVADGASNPFHQRVGEVRNTSGMALRVKVHSHLSLDLLTAIGTIMMYVLRQNGKSTCTGDNHTTSRNTVYRNCYTSALWGFIWVTLPWKVGKRAPEELCTDRSLLFFTLQLGMNVLVVVPFEPAHRLKLI